MEAKTKLSKFAKYAWFTLGYNILVILWGVFLRASKSGDGCGQHWLTCHGEVIPSAPEFKTVIEFSHRLTSGLAFLIVLVLVIWAFRKFAKGHYLRKAAVISFFFIITEALVGAGLVLTGNTAEAITPYRPYWAIGHLINTFILLAGLTLTAWFASGGKPPNLRKHPKVTALLALSVAGILFVGITGAIAALSNMLFEPSGSLMEGLQKDFSADSHILLRLRIFHPFSSVLVSVLLIFVAGWLKAKAEGNLQVTRWTGILSLLVIIQIIFGGLTLVTGAPIVMQLIHLLLADAVWIAFILMSVTYLADEEILP